MVERKKTCGHEAFNGNVDDPDYAYCGLTPAHAGDHGKWEV